MALPPLQPSPGAQLRALLKQLPSRGSLAMPGSFNGFVGRAAAHAGFEATYVSGAGVSACMGLPDIGLAGLEDFCRIIRDVSACSGLPVLADCDTGFGEVEGVSRVVHEYSRAGAAGFHIEDQVFPKRCGHLDGKQVVPAKDFALKIRAAAEARDALGQQFVVCARTDARAVHGLDDTIDRARRYVDSGADMIFPEGLQSEQEFEQVAKALQGYNGINYGEGPFLLANMTEFGQTPLLPLAKFSQLGYHGTLFPMTLFRFAMRGMMQGLKLLKEEGHISTESLDQMMTRKETYEILRYKPGEQWVYPRTPPR